MISAHKVRNGLAVAAMALMMIPTGCKSSEDKANEQAVEQAKRQAAAMGTAQQVISADKDGNTITTVVQPPVQGQTTQQVTVTKTMRSTTNAKMAPVTPAPVTSGPVTTTMSGPVGQAPAAAGYDASQPAPGTPLIQPLDVNVPAGTTLAIRINQYISVKTSHAGQRFTGEVVNPVMVGNSIAIPTRTPVSGVIDEAHRRGHFKGRSILELRLTSMRLNGQEYGLDTHDNVRTKKGKGKRSAAFIGGGTGAGMLIGGLASGGVGLVVGGLAGAGVGTAIGGLTGNRDLVIPAESVVNFKLADDLVVQPQ